MPEGSVLVVEDDAKTAGIVRLYLENARFSVVVARTGLEALVSARSRPFDIVLLDLMLPELDGRAVCRVLRAELDVPVIMLTARTSEDDKLDGLALGADDYVTKPFSPRELVARVKAVLRRARPEKPERPGRGPTLLKTRSLLLDLSRHEARVDGRPVALTPAEFSLLTVFVRAPGRTFTRQELVERAFGEDFEGLERTVDAHVMRLRKKIERDSCVPTLVITVFGIGYRLDDAP